MILRIPDRDIKKLDQSHDLMEFTHQSVSERDSFTRAYPNPMPTGFMLKSEHSPDGMKTRVWPGEITHEDVVHMFGASIAAAVAKLRAAEGEHVPSDDAPPQGDGNGAPPANQQPAGDINALSKMSMPELETKAAEVGAEFKKGMSKAAAIAAIKQAIQASADAEAK